MNVVLVECLKKKGAMTPEKEKFVGDLFNKFSSNMQIGAMEVRLHWPLLDEEILGAVRAWAISEAGYDAAQQQVNIAVGMLGIPGSGTDPRAAAVKGFAGILFSIAQSRGDPPFDAAFCDHALDAATGKLGSMQALQLLASSQPQISALINLPFGRFFFADPMVELVLGQTVRVLGVLAMPRKQLYDLYVSQHQDKTEGFRAAFRLALAEVQARASSEFSYAHELATEALRLAAQTPEAEDDIQAIQQLVELRVLVEPEIIESAGRLAHLAVQPQNAVGLVNCMNYVYYAAQEKRIGQQVLPNLADAAERLLTKDLEHDAWISAADAAILYAARAGRQAKAEALLAQFRQRATNDKERERLDYLGALVKWLRGDQDGAFALLEASFPKASRFTGSLQIEQLFRRGVRALQIVQMWPPGRPGREQFVDIFWEGMGAFPGGFALVPILLQFTVQDFGDEPAAAVLERLDLGRFEATMSGTQRHVFEEQMKPLERLRHPRTTQIRMKSAA